MNRVCREQEKPESFHVLCGFACVTFTGWGLKGMKVAEYSSLESIDKLSIAATAHCPESTLTLFFLSPYIAVSSFNFNFSFKTIARARGTFTFITCDPNLTPWQFLIFIWKVLRLIQPSAPIKFFSSSPGCCSLWIRKGLHTPYTGRVEEYAILGELRESYGEIVYS